MKRSNTKYFASHIQSARDDQQLTYDDVSKSAWVPADIQRLIENGEHTVLAAEWLEGYDQAFGWPRGYAAALAEMGAYQGHAVHSDALRGGERDAQASKEFMREPPTDVWKTFTALGAAGKSYPSVGFNVMTGDPVHIEGPILTNVAVKDLGAIALSWKGHTTVDVRLTRDGGVDLSDIATGNRHQEYRGVAERGVDVYATGVDMRYGKDRVTNIGVDPLIDLRSFDTARALAAALLELRPGVPTTVMRAALTFLAAARFTDDPLNTLIQLKRAQTPGSLSPAGRKRCEEFAAYWDEHFLTLDLGWEAAQPDPVAVELLAGVVASRDLLADVEPPRDAEDGDDAVKVLGPDELLHRGDKKPAVLFYDSAVAPELPLALHQFSPAVGLVFHSAVLDSPRLGAGTGEPYMFGRDVLYVLHSVGITDGEDRAIVSRCQGLALGTLTNYHRGQAIYCNSMGAQRIWIPAH